MLLRSLNPVLGPRNAICLIVINVGYVVPEPEIQAGEFKAIKMFIPRLVLDHENKVAVIFLFKFPLPWTLTLVI